jgi:hypothetical protein
LNVSGKVWAGIVALIVVLGIAVTRLGHSGSDYKSTVTEYDCNVQITTTPEAFQKSILATVTFSCKTAPKTTDLILTLQTKDAAGKWVDAAPGKEFTGTPTTGKLAMNASATCAAGDWRTEYHFKGTGAQTGKPFDIAPVDGSSVSISAADCANS